MKKVILPFISVLLVVAVAFGTGKKEKMEGLDETAQKVYSTALAASSPWLPVNPAFASLNMSLIGVAYSPTNSNVLWVSGTGSGGKLVFRSTDGGKNWSQNTVSTAGITSIAVKNDTIAIVGLYTGEILRTKNGGVKWDTVAAIYGSGAYMDGVAFVGVNRDTAIAIGDADPAGSYITRSTNGGLTWTRINTLPAPDQEASGYASSATYGQALSVAGNTIWTTWYFGSSRNPRIVKSTDAGVTWTGFECALPGGMTNNYYFRSINMKGDSIGYAAGRRIGTTTDVDNYLMKTTNGGTSWDSISVEPTAAHNVQKVYAAKPIPGTNQVVAVGFSTTTGAKSWWSTDDGATWTKLTTPGTSNLTNAAFVSPTVGFAVGGLQGLLYSPSVAVTFMANTSGVPDTLKTNSTVQIRGATSQLTWDNNSVKMANAGGDYWKTTVRFRPTDTLYYKFFTNAKSAITGSDNGYEANITPDASNNRVLILKNNDTTLALQYVNGFKNPAGPLEGPFVAKPDSYTCYIRVNMQSFADFNPALHVVGVRGSFAASNWGTTIVGNVEGQHANPGQVSYDGTHFYNLAVRFPKTMVDTAIFNPVAMSYKWVIHAVGHSLTEDWTLMVNNPGFQQQFNMPKKDTTINWIWYNNTPYIPPSGTDTTTFVFVTNLAKAIQSNSIKPGDSVSVRFGYNGSAALVTTHLMVKKGLSATLYVDTAKVIGVKVDTLPHFYYQYYLTKNATEYREVYYDFFYTGTDQSLAEKRKATVTGKNITIVVYDTLTGGAAANRQPVWQSTVKLARNVHVTFTCDLRPAYYTLANGDSIFDVQSSTPSLGVSSRDSVYNWGVWINGPAVGGWTQPTGDWGLALRAVLAKKMYDDGTHGDKVAGDHIYSMQQWFYKDSLNNTVGQVFKFGLNGGDNSNGSLAGFGNNNVENINDADTIATIASDFGNINPKYYRFWNYTTHTTGVQKIDGVPLTYGLDQNYPNPFNPSTTINYSIPVSGRVTLRVFNVLGQEVGTLLNSDQNAGKYQVTFDASRYSSGVYFYRIEAGTFSAVKKMMLLK